MDRSRFRRSAILVSACWMGTLLATPPTQANDEQIETALQQLSTGEFIEEPLEHVAAYFSDFHSIRIHIDERALENAGIDIREPITLSAHGIRLESLLGLILESRGLTWTVRYDSLIITTHDEARKAVSTRIYRLGDRLRQAVVDGNPYVNAYGGYGDGAGTMIVAAITTTIEPQSWLEGGPGRASIFSIGEQTVLVIRQDYRTHRMIEQLLNDLEQTGGEQSKAPSAGSQQHPFPPAASVPPETPRHAPARPADDPFVAPAPARDPFGEAGPSETHPADDPFGAPAASEGKRR